MTEKVTLVEVGPRDGLQSEKRFISSRDKLHLIKLLSEAGLSHIEVTSFVSPKAVPQMADAEEIVQSLSATKSSIRYTSLVPNLKGLERALSAGASSLAVFASATESFSLKNLGCSIEESLNRYKEVVASAMNRSIPVRGYVSCVLGCPYEGEVKPKQVVTVAKQLIDFGCSEVSLGDTIGVGTPTPTKLLLRTCLTEIAVERLAVHFHDTYGQAIANIFSALESGVRIIDAAVGGLGGCPFAPGAAGNVATEDVLYLLSHEGMETSVSQDKLLEASQFASDILGRSPRSRVALACLPHFPT